MTITFLILGAVVVLFVWNRIPVELVAVGAALSLYFTGVLEVEEALTSFGDPAVVLIAALFVVSEGLDATGVTAWAGQQLIARVGESRTRLIVLVLLLVAFLTALISVNGSVAALTPMVVVLALRTGRPTSQLLMPLAFGAHAGSMLALTGTPVNVLVSDAARGAGTGPFGFFEFTLVGVPLVAGTIAIVVLFGQRLLPERTPESLPADLSDHARTMTRQYLSDHRVYRLRVEGGAACIGGQERDLPETEDLDIEVVGVQANGTGLAIHPSTINEGDVLIVRGDDDHVTRFAARVGLALEAEPFQVDPNGAVLDREIGVSEVVIPPRSPAVGEKVFPGMVTDSGDLVILAVQRKGEDIGPEPVKLAVGDTLLVQGQWIDLDRHVPSDPAVLVVDEPQRVRRQAVPLGPGSKAAVAIVAAMVAALATGAVPAVVAGLTAAGAMILFRVIDVDQAYRGISWTTIVLVGAMMPLSTAMTKTGAADRIATGLVDLIGDRGPYALLFGLFVLTAVMGQLISNMATALIVIPIGVSAAVELGVSPRPVLMSITVAAAAALLTPVATPANLMVMGPGGYRFGDYWKLGLPLLCLYLAVSVGLVPLIWSF
ncbi:MAG: SLC13 family permease [Microthrixaceae bacterium]|jgi:di/tricarboxylate transporter|nr:SLC13 family permease [Microthrixaceae bacterium]